MKIKRNQIYALAGIAVASVSSYYLFRRRRIKFYDNVFCNDDCTNIADAVAFCQGDHQEVGGDRNTSASKTLTAACVNDSSNDDEKVIFEAQEDIGLIDSTGASLVTSQAQANQVALANIGEQEDRAFDEEPNTGMFNLIFAEPHGLEEGDEINVQQNVTDDTMSSYNGKTVVTKVYNKHTIRTNKPRLGSSPVVGGYITLPSVWSSMIA